MPRPLRDLRGRRSVILSAILVGGCAGVPGGKTPGVVLATFGRAKVAFTQTKESRSPSRRKIKLRLAGRCGHRPLQHT